MRVLADGRVRRTEAEWRALLERFEKSGLSMSAFCRRAGVPRSGLVKWRRRLMGKASPAPAFVEWVAPSRAEAGSVDAAPRGAGELELTLPGGVALRWRA